MTHNNYKKILLSGAMLLAIFFIAGKISLAQNNIAFLVSWGADTYVPSDYQGKRLPTRNSRVEISFELIESGKIVDLSRNKVRWYVNSEQIASEIGKKTLTYALDKRAGSAPSVKIEIPDYKGNTIKHIFTLPLATPKVVIISNNKTLVGLPFFFNVSRQTELAWQWKINGESAQGQVTRPDIIELDFSQSSGLREISVELITKNLANVFEVASNLIKFDIQ
jgi:hypothetical protein